MQGCALIARNIFFSTTLTHFKLPSQTRGDGKMPYNLFYGTTKSWKRSKNKDMLCMQCKSVQKNKWHVAP